MRARLGAKREVIVSRRDAGVLRRPGAGDRGGSARVLFRRLAVAAGLLAADFGHGLVNELIEAAAVYDFNEGRSVGGAGDDPNGRGVLDADALAERVVGFHFFGQVAHGIDGEGQGDAVLGGPFLRELLEIAGSLDGRLIGEDVVAIVVAEGLAFGVKEAGVDGGLEAPVVLREREVVADPGDVVFGGGVFEEGVCAGAVGALEIFKLDDGDASAGGRLEGGGIVDLGGIGRAELGVSRGGDQRGEGEGERKAGEVPAQGEMKAAETMHGVWTAP